MSCITIDEDNDFSQKTVDLFLPTLDFTFNE